MNQADTSEGFGESGKHHCRCVLSLQKCIVSPRVHHFHHEEQPLRCKMELYMNWECFLFTNQSSLTGKNRNDGTSRTANPELSKGGKLSSKAIVHV